MTRKEIMMAAAFLASVRPNKDTAREGWMIWRGICLREAQKHATSTDISTFLGWCGSPD